MKHIKQFLTFAFLIFLILYGCNKEDNTEIFPDPKVQQPQKPIVPKDSIEIDVELTLETMTNSLNLQSEALSKYNEYLQETSDVERAIFYTGLWLQKHHNVEEVAFTSSYIVHVTFKNGLQSNLVFLPEDENGKAIYRGAPNTSGNGVEKPDSKMPVKAFGGKSRASKSAEKEIKNKKVLIFNVEEEEFYDNDYSAPLAILNNEAATDLEVTVLSNEAARLEMVDEFYKYGLIIINTHGQPGSFSVKSGIKKWGLKDSFTQEIINENILEITKKNPTDFKDGTLTIDVVTRVKDEHTRHPVDIFEIKIGVTDKYIRSLKPLDDAVIFANFCYSGHEVEGPNTRNLVEAFKAIGAKTYYGWATDYGHGYTVLEEGAQKAELQFLRNLVRDGKLTGESHLLPGGEPIVMSLDTYENFAPGFSVYTILPKQDGAIDFNASYQKFWVNYQSPSNPRFTAYALQHRLDPGYYYDNDTDEIVFYVRTMELRETPWPAHDPIGLHMVPGFSFAPIEAPPNKKIVQYQIEGMEYIGYEGIDFTSSCGTRVFYPEYEDDDYDHLKEYFLPCGMGTKDWREVIIERVRGWPRIGYAKVTVTLKPI